SVGCSPNHAGKLKPRGHPAPLSYPTLPEAYAEVSRPPATNPFTPCRAPQQQLPLRFPPLALPFVTFRKHDLGRSSRLPCAACPSTSASMGLQASYSAVMKIFELQISSIATNWRRGSLCRCTSDGGSA